MNGYAWETLLLLKIASERDFLKQTIAIDRWYPF
jgi:hypothetical protein